MRLYLSGPMTGIPEYNYPAFHAAKAKLIGAGHDVISPADLPVRDGWEWIDYMIPGISSVFAADGVATLEGCETSKGARIECMIAAERGIQVQPVAFWLARVAP